MNVFLLWHTNGSLDGEENSKLIGVYSTKDLADNAQERAANLPGFHDKPQGFAIDSYEMNKDHWSEGFIN
jgi:hypothetical protein